jgi:hypothetical protein
VPERAPVPELAESTALPFAPSVVFPQAATNVNARQVAAYFAFLMNELSI